MSWIYKAFGIAALVVLTVAPGSAQMRRPYRGGGVVIVRPHGYYAPAWPGYWGPWYGAEPVYAAPATGEVKIDTKMKNVSVYVDGGYVGPINKFKKFSLRPGSYQIELRDAAGHSIFIQRVQIILDKTVEIRPNT